MREDVKSIIRIYKMTVWSSILKWFLYIPATIGYLLVLIVKFGGRFDLKVYALWSVIALVIGFVINILFEYCMTWCKKRNLYFSESCGKNELSSARIADLIMKSYQIHEEMEKFAEDTPKMLRFDTKRHDEVLKGYAELWIDTSCREYNELIDRAVAVNEYGFVKEFLETQIALKEVFIKIYNYNTRRCERLERWFESFECEYQKLLDRKF